MGLCMTKPKDDGDDSDHNVEFSGGNVNIITTKESWDQKLEEAKRDGKVDFSSSWDIKATPTFFFLRDGQQIDKLVGANKPELQKKITAVVDSTTGDQK
ncbi:Thioredoxin [Parasponia andersonii]|uniref:Thioredoxin n=1 Tax=Parasponia andersonii TaxID=3476 RepID=A0A2P5APE1_PARAD|nr:Thioredoxin [Parasponia andersonii]